MIESDCNNNCDFQSHENIEKYFKQSSQNFDRNVILVFDECKIQEGLVWNKNDEVVGVVDLGSGDVDLALLGKFCLMQVL